MAALFSGNSVVLKCSEQVVWSSNWFVQAIKECLKACGHDEDLVQVGDTILLWRTLLIIPAAACMLLPRRCRSTYQVPIRSAHYVHWLRTRRPYCAHLVLYSYGRAKCVVQVAQAATEYLTPCTMELGGKDPAIIMPSTDLEKYISLLMRGV